MLRYFQGSFIRATFSFKPFDDAMEKTKTDMNAKTTNRVVIS